MPIATVSMVVFKECRAQTQPFRLGCTAMTGRRHSSRRDSNTTNPTGQTQYAKITNEK